MTDKYNAINLNKLEVNLEVIYDKIFSGMANPAGMFNVKPSIPFVGNLYGIVAPKVISYASAENLSYAFSDNLHPATDQRIHSPDYNQYTRARDFYYDNIPTYFPYIHCSPFNDGPQLLLTRHILNILGHDALFSNHPYGFIEQISAGNSGKFSVESEGNKDYAGCKHKMNYSLDYIQKDFNLLQPQIIILPRTIFNTIDGIKKWGDILNTANIKSATFIKIYQLAFFNNHRVQGETEGFPDFIDQRTGYFDWINKTNGSVDINSHLKWIDNCLDIQHIGS